MTRAQDPVTSGPWVLFPTAVETDIGGGGGYRRASKRFAVAILGTIAVVLLSGYARTAAPGGVASDDGLAPPAEHVQCGRTIQEYMQDIDSACCGSINLLHGDPMCSGPMLDVLDVAGRSWSDGAIGTIVENSDGEHTLYICNDLCAMTVLPLWEQCILPELGTPLHGMATPLWIFEPVVAKCSRPRPERSVCIDDDTVTDPFLTTFVPKDIMNARLNTSDASAPSLCEEIRTGLNTCENVRAADPDPNGLHPWVDSIYPSGWYDNIAGGTTCCASCPAYWPRRALRGQERWHGTNSTLSLEEASLFHPDILTDEYAFKAIIAKMEQQDVEDAMFPARGPPYIAPGTGTLTAPGTGTVTVPQLPLPDGSLPPNIPPAGELLQPQLPVAGASPETAPVIAPGTTLPVESDGAEPSHNKTSNAPPVSDARETDDEPSIKGVGAKNSDAGTTGAQTAAKH